MMTRKTAKVAKAAKAKARNQKTKPKMEAKVEAKIWKQNKAIEECLKGTSIESNTF